MNTFRSFLVAVFFAAAFFLYSQLNVPAQKEGQAPAGPIQLLFLGDKGHHQPALRVAELKAALGSKGIFITYTEDLDDMNPEYLAKFDGLVVYANIATIDKDGEKAILDYVAGGKGYIPLHCASYCFHNSPKLIALLGAQFKSHGTGVFRTSITQPDHPLLKGFSGFESWDETYVHHKHNEVDRTVLAYREEKGKREPWTWVRTHGKGRVFYTAWGHDQRTWTNPGFHNLVQRGILWAVNKDARERWELLDMPEFKFTEADVPNYEKRDPPPKFQHPLKAEESMKTIQVPVDFRLELFAAEPQIANPAAIAWDERGRCWVAETVDYPNDMKISGEGKDSIKILEDTDGDGRCDKVKVFADGLSIPTGMVFARGGLIVSQAPHMLFLKDTDGDDRADVREVLFSGWGTGDTHAGPSSLHYGLDGWIYGAVGYSSFGGEVGGKRHRFGNGFYRFTADGKQMEFLTKSSNNTWGLGQSETGEWFGSTANNTHSLHLGLPERLYEGATGLGKLPSRKIDGHYHMTGITNEIRQVDVHGGFTAAAGHNLYTARDYPEQYWNRIAFVNEPTGHLVHSAVLVKEGSSFVEKDGRNLLASADAWCAPVFSQVGPDGQVWVADWYDFIIQHNPLPKGFKMGKGNAYITPLRDQQRARIYRVIYEGREPAKPPVLDIKKPQSLIAALGHSNMHWRLSAHRMLVDRGQPDVAPALEKVVRAERELDAIGSDPAALHALWVLQSLGKVNDALLIAALKHKAASVRRAAVIMLPHDAAHRDLLIESGALTDDSPNVQLAALSALIEMPVDPLVGDALVEALAELSGTNDHWLPTAFSLAAIRNAESFLDALVKSRPPAEEGLTAAEVKARKQVNLIPNAGFEQLEGKSPKGWLTRTWSGEPQLVIDSESAASGKNCVRISADKASEAGHYLEVDVKAHMVYRLRAWVKTEGLQGSGRGALFYLPEVSRNGTRSLKGTNDWQRIEHEFDTEGNTRIRIYCMFGGWGKSTGTAWYDDLELVALHPSLGNQLNVGVSSVVARNFAAKAKAETLRPWIELMPKINPELVEPLIEGFSAGWPAGVAVPLEPAQLARMQSLVNRLPLGRQTDLMTLALKAGITGLVSSAPEPDLGDVSTATVIRLGTVKEKMIFDKTSLKVTAGKRIKLVFDNNDSMPHNFIIGRPGSLERLGQAADRMLTDPNAVKRGYVPDTPDVIASLGLLFPGQKEVLNFTAPKEPGQYDYVCTFPGHWRLMKGVLTVVGAQ